MSRRTIGKARRWLAGELRAGRALLRHPRVPRASKALLGAALAYAAMPFDLVPDWIPIAGQLDDVVIVGGLVWLAWRIVPDDVRRECRARSAPEREADRR